MRWACSRTRRSTGTTSSRARTTRPAVWTSTLQRAVATAAALGHETQAWRALDEIDQLQFLVDRHAIERAVHPESWIDLLDAGLLPAVPVDPLRVPYAYDPATHRVSLSPTSPLGPLPVGLVRQ